MKIIVTAGGTLGHINPALAIIEYFKKQEKTEVLFIGTHNRMEKDIIPKKGYKYLPLEMYGFSKNIFKNIKNISLINKAYHKVLKTIDEFKPDLVIACGGYVTYPVAKAAHKRKIKLFIHEQNLIPGKSNKMIAGFADIVGITFESTRKQFSHAKKVIYTGHPSASKALTINKIDKTTLGFSKGKKLLVISAGSLGSFTINEKMYEYLKDYSKCEVLLITGKDNYEEFIKNKIIPNHIKVLPFLDNLSGLLKDADVVVSRAGAASVCEIVALQIPSIIIPSPFVANNHQYYTAKELSDENCVIMIEEKNITKKDFIDNLNKLLTSKETELKMKNAMKKRQTEDANKIIYDALKK